MRTVRARFQSASRLAPCARLGHFAASARGTGHIMCRAPSRGLSGSPSKLPFQGLLFRRAAGGGDRLHLVDEAGPIDIGLDGIAEEAGRRFELRLRRPLGASEAPRPSPRRARRSPPGPVPLAE